MYSLKLWNNREAKISTSAPWAERLLACLEVGLLPSWWEAHSRHEKGTEWSCYLGFGWRLYFNVNNGDYGRAEAAAASLLLRHAGGKRFLHNLGAWYEPDRRISMAELLNTPDDDSDIEF